MDLLSHQAKSYIFSLWDNMLQLHLPATVAMTTPLKLDRRWLRGPHCEKQVWQFPFLSPFFQSFGLFGVIPNLKSSFKQLLLWHKCVCVCFHCFKFRSCTLVISFGWSTLLTAAKIPPLMIRLEDFRWAKVYVEAGSYMMKGRPDGQTQINKSVNLCWCQRFMIGVLNNVK